MSNWLTGSPLNPMHLSLRCGAKRFVNVRQATKRLHMATLWRIFVRHRTKCEMLRIAPGRIYAYQTPQVRYRAPKLASSSVEYVRRTTAAGCRASKKDLAQALNSLL